MLSGAALTAAVREGRRVSCDEGGCYAGPKPEATPPNRVKSDNGGYERNPADDAWISQQNAKNAADKAWWAQHRPKIVQEDKSLAQKLAEAEQRLKESASNAARAKIEDALKPSAHGAFEGRAKASEGTEVQDPGVPDIAGGIQKTAGDVGAAGAVVLTTVAIEGGKFAVLDGAGRIVGEFADAAAARAFTREVEAGSESRVVAATRTTSQNAAELSRNLVREERGVGEGEAAAHVVASTGSRGHWAASARSRSLLERYGIDVNDAANGIPLGHPRPHNIMHTGAFQAQVEERLSAVVERMKAAGYGQKATRAALRRELRAIGREVLQEVK